MGFIEYLLKFLNDVLCPAPAVSRSRVPPTYFVFDPAILGFSAYYL